MSAAIQIAPPDLRDELINWQERLEASTKESADGFELNSLLREVKAAIERLGQADSYGVCQVCHDLIGQAAMNADPLAQNCLRCLTPEQLEELQQDLDRAWLVQGDLLPKQDLKFNGWEVAYRYEAAGPVSGDYCDLVSTDKGDLYFLIGDVSGKGVAASFLMGRLHAIFRSLIGEDLGVAQSDFCGDDDAPVLRDACLRQSLYRWPRRNLQCRALSAVGASRRSRLVDRFKWFPGRYVLPEELYVQPRKDRQRRPAVALHRWIVRSPRPAEH